MTTEQGPGHTVRARSALTGSMPVGWASAEMLVMASPDGTTRVEAQRLTSGTPADNWRAARIAQLSALNHAIEIRPDLVTVEIGGGGHPAVAFKAPSADDSVTAGLSVLLDGGRVPIIATVTSSSSLSPDEMVSLIERADIVATDDAIAQAFEALAPETTTTPANANERPTEARWLAAHTAWLRHLDGDILDADDHSEEVLVVATPEEIATLAAVAGCPAPVGLDLSWIGALDGDARRGVATAAARALLARQVLGRTADGSLYLPETLADALCVAADPGLMVETQRIDTNGVVSAAVVLAQPDQSTRIAVLDHEARALSIFPTTQLLTHLVGPVPSDGAAVAATVSADALEAHFSGGPDGQIAAVVGPEATLQVVRTFHQSNESWGGSMVRWIRSEAGAWLVNEHHDGWSLSPAAGAVLASSLLEILPGGGATT